MSTFKFKFDPRQHNFNNHAGGQELELTSRPHNLRALANAAMRQTVTRTVAVDGSSPYCSKQDLDRIESANIIAITVTVTSSSSLLSLAPAVTHSLPPLLPLSQIPARPHFRSPLLPLSFTYALPHYRSHSLPLSLTPALTHSRSPSLPLSITFAKGTSTSRLWFL